MGQKKGKRLVDEVSNYIVVHVMRSHFYCLQFNASTSTHCILGLHASG